MKNFLLFTFAIGITFSVSAQSANKYLHIKGTNIASFNPKNIDAPLSQPSVLKSVAKKNVTSSNSKMFAVSVVSLGQAVNALGLCNGGRTALWADPNLNSIMFTHREVNPGGTISFDFSKDGGSTFTNNVISYNTTGNGARYPEGLIYNPSGNTNPDNAFALTFSALLDGSNAGGGSNWGGYAISTKTFNSTGTPNEQSLTSQGAYLQQIPEAFHINPVSGVAWVVDPAENGALNNGYTNSLILSKGVFNSGTNKFDFTQSLFSAPMSVMNTGKYAQIANTRIAFAPNGTTGWISLLSHNDFTLYPDSCFYPIFYKTTDGGVSWSAPINVNMMAIDAIKNFISDANLALLFGHQPVPGTRDSLLYTTAFDADMAVDGNGNPYLAVDVSIGVGKWSISKIPGAFGMFLIFSPDGGTTWNAKLLDYPETFRGTFTGGTSDISEDNRPQISTTYNGSKMFVTWLDTDTLSFGSTDGNYYPDIHFRAYDPATGLLTNARSITTGTEADGAAYMGTASYYVFDNGGTYELPLVYQVMDPSSNGSPVQFNYIKGFTVTDADFNMTVGEDQLVKNNISVSQNYPNPFSDFSNIDVTLDKSTNLAMEVYNLVGQKVYEINKGMANAGKHKFIIDASSLTSGIYFYQVKAGEYTQTGKMVIE